MLDRIHDTIVAIATAPGSSPLGVVRLSGPASIEIAANMAKPESADSIRRAQGSTRIECHLSVETTGELPAACLVFRAPHSYTRQNAVEIHTIGSPAVLEFVRRRALELGAISALPGEFTARAFVNGAMDLASAEAVAGVIRARSDTQLAAARRMMDGALAQRITALRNELAELLALVEADIDFAEEPIEFISPSAARDSLGSVRATLDDLLRGSVTAERFDTLPRILLLGRPNAGKSTLMNALCGHSRAITAAVTGTTRDILSAPIRLGGAEATLLDAAGVDESDDEIIARARAMVLAEVDRVDLVCLVVDLTNPELTRVRGMIESLRSPRLIIAANKADVVNVECRIANSECRAGRARLEEFAVPDAPVVFVSALTGQGLNDLRTAFADTLSDQPTTTLGESILITERQGAAIRDAEASLTRAIELCQHAIETIDCADLLAFELREALNTLGTVTGAVTTEDLLGQVFARFCIGK